MAGRSRSTSEERWVLLDDRALQGHASQRRQVQREAEARAVVCDQHGGAARQGRRRAAERLIITANQATQMLVTMMEDTEVPFGVRAKIAQDLLDRAGLIATHVHKIIPTAEDTIIRFFADAFNDPNNWEENPPQLVIEERLIDRTDPDIEAEIAEPEGEPANATPLRVAEMINPGAFGHKPRQ